MRIESHFPRVHINREIDKNRKTEDMSVKKIITSALSMYLLFFLDVPRAIIRIFTRELMWMGLYRKRIKYLHHLTKIDTLY